MFVILGMGIFFVALAFILSENNARYLLSGYNTMSEEERRKFDISGYIPYFKKFHLFLGVSLALMGMPISYIYGDDAGGIFLAAYTLLGYTFFIVSSRKFMSGKRK